ncbi:MAG TPA: Na/Pi cotransporter family protein [bacterium]|nr:Na/Pi cotransporter family protein [bacterium]
MLDVFQVIGGLALFLYGVKTLSAGMEKLTGTQIQRWMDRMTGTPAKGAVFGMVATALVQSSSLVMVTMIGLINAKIMTLTQVISVMLGQEIGTTVTAQMVAFKVGNLSFFLLALGFVLIEWNPRQKGREWGEILFGMGLIFLGMNLMSSSLAVVTKTPAIAELLARLGQNLFLGILAGMVATAVVQSSSAITCLVVAMGMNQAISLSGAVALLLGANIGTCVTGFLASMRLSRVARQASIAQILINLIGVLAILPFIPWFLALVARTSTDLPRQIANAHTIFNVLVSIALFPFIAVIARLTRLIVPDEKEVQSKLATYIDPAQYKIPSVALAGAKREVAHMGNKALEMLEASARAVVQSDLPAAEQVIELEDQLINPLTELLEQYLNDLMGIDLSVSQQKQCFQIKKNVYDIERIGDLFCNIARVAMRKQEQHITFSQQAEEDLQQYFAHVKRAGTLALESISTADQALAREVCELEDESNTLYLRFCDNHIERSNAGICKPESDVLFIEILRDLERIADHTDNLSLAVLRS